jgi:hypothetical protein
MGIIKDAYNNTCAYETLSVIPSFESIIIENKLLNGTAHIQTIGSPIKIASARALCRFDQITNLMEAYAKGTKIFIDFEDIYFDGTIKSQPIISQYSKSQRGNRIYEATFVLYVEEEG